MEKQPQQFTIPLPSISPATPPDDPLAPLLTWIDASAMLFSFQQRHIVHRENLQTREPGEMED